MPARATKNIAGMMIRPRKTAKFHCAGLCDRIVKKWTTWRANITPSAASTPKMAAMSQNTFCANDHASARGLSLKYPVNTGMNAAPSAPSPDNRRIRLGI